MAGGDDNNEQCSSKNVANTSSTSGGNQQQQQNKKKNNPRGGGGGRGRGRGGRGGREGGGRGGGGGGGGRGMGRGGRGRGGKGGGRGRGHSSSNKNNSSTAAAADVTAASGEEQKPKQQQQQQHASSNSNDNNAELSPPPQGKNDNDNASNNRKQQQQQQHKQKHPPEQGSSSGEATSSNTAAATTTTTGSTSKSNTTGRFYHKVHHHHHHRGGRGRGRGGRFSGRGRGRGRHGGGGRYRGGGGGRSAGGRHQHGDNSRGTTTSTQDDGEEEEEVEYEYEYEGDHVDEQQPTLNNDKDLSSSVIQNEERRRKEEVLIKQHDNKEETATTTTASTAPTSATASPSGATNNNTNSDDCSAAAAAAVRVVVDADGGEPVPHTATGKERTDADADAAVNTTKITEAPQVATRGNDVDPPPPPPPPIQPPVILKGGTNGVPMLLSRSGGGGSGGGSSSKEDQEQQQQLLAQAAAAATQQQQKQQQQKAAKKKKKDAAGNKKKKKKKAKKKKKTHHDEDDDGDWSDDYGEYDDDSDDGRDGTDHHHRHRHHLQVTTATEALEKLPAQEVSITADTQVTINNSTTSNNTNDKALTPPSSSNVPIMLLNRNNLIGTGNDKKSTASSSTKKKKSKNKSRQDNSDDPQRSARKFNNAVRLCLESGDPEAMRKLLRHKKNKHYCLEATVLEAVMKAYVMAALFDDALYCLRNCAMPSTLDIHATERILQCLPQNLRNSSSYTAADMINALCVATDFGPAEDAQSKQRRTWFLRILRGISLEFLEEATSARDRICSASCERLVRAGVCVVDAVLKRGKKVSELIVIPGEQLGCFIPTTTSSTSEGTSNDQRGIATGDAVSILPYAGPYPLSAESLDRNMIEATVTNTNPMVLRLQDKLNANLYAMLTSPEEGNVYRIDKLANRMGFNRQLTAANSIATPPLAQHVPRDTRRPCPQLIKAITAMDENIDRVMRRSAAQKGALPRGEELTSTAALCAQPIPWNVEDENDKYDDDTVRSFARLALEKYDALEGLNASQRLAVEGAITNRLTLIQGPPGTGKTMVAIRILQQWAKLSEASCSKDKNPAPILATSDSNIAVDNLVEGCAAVGLRVVRLGRPEAIRPELLRYCVDRPNTATSSGTDKSYYRESYNNYNSSSYINHKERLKQLKSAQIVCCTCIGSGSDMLDALGPLERVLVDEATQATEPAVVVPLMRGCRQLVLVGDHCQLPPTVLSTTAEEEGHGVPLFSRMVACGVPPYMLDTQYRMHPAIAMFPSDLFYGGLLKNGVTAPERRPLPGFPWPVSEFPVAFVPVQGDELDDGVSKYNEAEAAAACDAVVALLEGGQCSVSDIAVVTPYSAQARLIRRLIKRLPPFNTGGPPYIEVSSVDGFQGREKEAVVFSAVRSNDYAAIGFTSDWRRVNVSFTRARRALIVIGNAETLRRGDQETWMPWLAWADAHGLNMDKPGMPRGRYDPEQMRRVRGGTTAAEMLKDVLERQQTQLKNAQQQQERAEFNTRGHITGGIGIAGVSADGKDDTGQGGNDDGMKPLNTLEEDLAMMENIDGNWDDSEEESSTELRHSVSRTTLTSAASSSNDLRSGDESGSSSSSNAVDIWDI